VNKVCKYILDQKAYHHKQTSAEEYDEFIKFYQQTIILPKNKVIRLVCRGSRFSIKVEKKKIWYIPVYRKGFKEKDKLAITSQ